MSDVPWMLLRLALDTSAHHAHADEDRLRALDIKTRDEYRSFLVRVYGFEAPVERALERMKAAVAPEMPFHGRYKVPALHQDLLALDLSANDIAELPVAVALNIRSIAQALGWLFVIERHTLLSGLIRRHIQRTAGDAANVALGYLAASGDAPGTRFRTLGEIVGDYVARGCAPTAIAAAANEAFRVQRQWYRSGGSMAFRHAHSKRAAAAG